MVLVALSVDHDAPVVWGGFRLHEGELIIIGAAQSTHMRSAGPCRWGAIWLPAQELARYSKALSGTVFTVSDLTRPWRPPCGSGAQLHRLFCAAIGMARARPGHVTEADAAHGLEQQLIQLLVECLPTKPMMMPPCRAQHVMGRFEELVRSRLEGDLSLAQISAALNVPERSLRKYCEDHLGLSPMSYARLHRMQQVNRLLREAASPAINVAAAAAHFGFRNPGRFAGVYRELYGELPSRTRRRGLRLQD
jgi:AraC-like DNA-binding protein